MAFRAGEDDERDPDPPVWPGRNPRRSGGDEKTTALHHPVRRVILRSIHACGCGRSATELAAEMGLDLSTVSYHVCVLADADCLTGTPATGERGYRGRRFKSTVEDDRAALLILSSTEHEDAEDLRQRRSAQAAADG